MNIDQKVILLQKATEWEHASVAAALASVGFSYGRAPVVLSHKEQAAKKDFLDYLNSLVEE